MGIASVLSIIFRNMSKIFILLLEGLILICPHCLIGMMAFIGFIKKFRSL